MRSVVMLAALPGLFTFVSAGSTVAQLLGSSVDVGALREPSENIVQASHFRTDETTPTNLTQPASGVFFGISADSTTLYALLRSEYQRKSATVSKFMGSAFTSVADGTHTVLTSDERKMKEMMPSKATAVRYAVMFTCEAAAVLLLMYMANVYLSEDKGTRDPTDMCETHSMLQMASKWSKAFWVCIWLTTGVSTVLLNAWLFSPTGGDCPYPISLTCYHQFVLYISTICLRYSPLGADLMPAVNRYGSLGGLSYVDYMTFIAPQGLLLCIGFALGNSAYLFLSIALVHMLKVLGPALQFMIAGCAGMEEFTWPTAILATLMTLSGVIICRGEMSLDAFGIVIQLFAVVALSARTIMLKKTLSVSNIDVFSSLYLVSPSICIFLLFPAYAMEWSESMTDAAFKIWASNTYVFISAIVAVLLNVSTAILLKSAAASSVAAIALARDMAIMMIAQCYTKGVPDRLSVTSALCLVTFVTMFVNTRMPTVKTLLPPTSSAVPPSRRPSRLMPDSLSHGSTTSTDGQERNDTDTTSSEGQEGDSPMEAARAG